jgi:putative CocE/NonD family hydrolase
MKNALENNIITEYDVPVEMGDGTVLRANIYHPAREGPWPVLLTRLPYGKDVPNLMLDPAQAARKGYVVIVQDTRGRYASEGDWDLIPSMNQESSDGIDTIHWAAKLPYSNGQIGMYGFSYFAFTQWAIMFNHPEVLKAAVPAFSWSDPFDGLLYRGGAIELGFLAFWQLPLYLDTHPRNYQDDHELAEAMSQLIIENTNKIVAAQRFCPF